MERQLIKYLPYVVRDYPEFQGITGSEQPEFERAWASADDLLNNKYSEKGFAPVYARDNFENCWKQYHSLGANGVMDDLHEKFLDLPTEAPNK